MIESVATDKLSFPAVPRFSSNLIFKAKIAVDCGFFYLTRALERRLSADQCYSLLKVIYFPRAFLNTLFKKPRPAGGRGPNFSPIHETRKTARERYMRRYLNRVLEYLQDRLGEPKWMRRCTFEGLEQVQRARREGRPVILAFSHSGPFVLLRMWMRSAGVPVVELVGPNLREPTRLGRLKDGLEPFKELPVRYYPHQLRELMKMVAANYPLFIAIDVANGKQVLVPISEEMSFQMPTGALRLAVHHGAELIPCSIIDEGRWHFRIKLGKPVPAELLDLEDEWPRAGKYLYDEIAQAYQSFPWQCRLAAACYPTPSPQPSKVEAAGI
jgi:lauroyl/myristoyl acyltransferase